MDGLSFCNPTIKWGKVCPSARYTDKAHEPPNDPQPRLRNSTANLPATHTNNSTYKIGRLYICQCLYRSTHHREVGDNSLFPWRATQRHPKLHDYSHLCEYPVLAEFVDRFGTLLHSQDVGIQWIDLSNRVAIFILLQAKGERWGPAIVQDEELSLEVAASLD